MSDSCLHLYYFEVTAQFPIGDGLSEFPFFPFPCCRKVFDECITKRQPICAESAHGLVDVTFPRKKRSEVEWPLDRVFTALVPAYPIGEFDSPITSHRPGDVEQLTDVEFDAKLVPHCKCSGVSIDEVTVSKHRSDVADEYRNAFSKPT